MPSPSPASSPTPPIWPYCGHGAGPQDPVGCRGIRVAAYSGCLAHLADADLGAYLAGLTPGTDIDHRGTPLTEPLLCALLEACRDPATANPRLGAARFEQAVFHSRARFRSVTFGNNVSFESAAFQDMAEFGSATFRERVSFRSATFQDMARFTSADFQGSADFEEAVFLDMAWFEKASFQEASFALASFQGYAEFAFAIFQGAAWFEEAAFSARARFAAATFQIGAMFKATAFQRDADFEQAIFERALSLGPLMCAGRVVLSGAVFGGPVTVSLATRRLECRRTRWSSTAEVRLRFTTVDFSHAVVEYPLTIAAEADPFVLPDGRPVDEQELAGAPDATVRVASLRGVDAAHLVLADVDLSACLFTGTVHLDQVRLEGACSFGKVPEWHWRRGRFVRFTTRRTLAEEHHWRARQSAPARGWNTAVFGAGPVGPTQLAPVYRALRKALEDGKDEPGAADFYYGEMEMRRHDRTGSTSRTERGLLHGYWLLSGYGLRASRALLWLAAAMFVTVMLLMGFGLPKDDPQQVATGTVPPGGGTVTFQIDRADPQNPTERITGERFEKAVNVTLNSVVFRSADQDLTTGGTYIEMASRVSEPVLLGLAILAVRNRVKR